MTVLATKDLILRGAWNTWRIGVGATINPDGSLAGVGGPALFFHQLSDPEGAVVANPGSFLVRYDAGQVRSYVKATGVGDVGWSQQAGGGAIGGGYLDGVELTFGTDILRRGVSVLNIGATRWDLVTRSITGGGALAGTYGMNLRTGNRVKNDADAGVPTSGPLIIQTGTTTIQGFAAIGGASGALTLGTGATDATFAGATGGASGVLTMVTGNTDVTAAVAAQGGATGAAFFGTGQALNTGATGLSGASGPANLFTGDSADGVSGQLNLYTGATFGAADTGSINGTTGQANGAGDSGGWDLSTGQAVGAGDSGDFAFSTGIANTGGSGNFSFRTGNVAAGAQDSGGFLFQTGTSFGGVRGSVQFNSGPVTFSEGTLTNLATAIEDSIGLALGVPLMLPFAHPGGAAEVDITLPARVGGWRIIDYFIRSNGGTGGSSIVRTATGGGGNAVTDAVVPGNANLLTRALSVITADCVFASGAHVYIDSPGGTPAYDGFLMVLPL